MLWVVGEIGVWVRACVVQMCGVRRVMEIDEICSVEDAVVRMRVSVTSEEPYWRREAVSPLAGEKVSVQEQSGRRIRRSVRVKVGDMIGFVR